MKTRKTQSRRSLQRMVRRMWADYDPMADKSSKVVVYQTKADQRSNRPDLEPIPVMVVHRELWRQKERDGGRIWCSLCKDYGSHYSSECPTPLGMTLTRTDMLDGKPVRCYIESKSPNSRGERPGPKDA